MGEEPDYPEAVHDNPNRMSYAVPEIRENRLAIVRELVTDYPTDGIELNFNTYAPLDRPSRGGGAHGDADGVDAGRAADGRRGGRGAGAQQEGSSSRGGRAGRQPQDWARHRDVGRRGTGGHDHRHACRRGFFRRDGAVAGACRGRGGERRVGHRGAGLRRHGPDATDAPGGDGQRLRRGCEGGDVPPVLPAAA